MAKIAMEMLSPTKDKLYTITDVTADEIFGLTSLMRFADIFNSNVMRKWVKEFMLLRISRFRLGRKEFLLLITGMKELAEERRKKAKVTELFSGLG